MFSDKTFMHFNKKDYRRLFLMGAVLGGLIFVMIYGIKVINPAYTQWIYYADNDLKQHYIGWCFYRNCEWRFPLGVSDRLSYPVGISVLYTDSIPGVALIFKIFSGILPLDFQYFGLVGFLSYILSSACAVVLLKRFIRSPWVCLLASPLFTVSFPMIQRMFYHTALAAQWIIFLSFIIWVYDTYPEKSLKPVIYWGAMGILCVSVHSYFLPIAGMILLADRVCFFAINKDRKAIQRITSALLPIVSFCAAAIIALWVYGAFYGSSSGTAGGLGTFGANFNTFINPGYYGAILPEMGYENYFQYEGCGYLGLGIILLSLYVDVMLILRMRQRKGLNEEVKSDAHFRRRLFIYTALGLFIVSFLCATLPKISIGKYNLGTVPYPKCIYKIASVFRSNGRFIWVGMYLIMFAAVTLAVKFTEENTELLKLRKAGEKPETGVVCIMLIAALIIQTADLSKMIKEKHDFYAAKDYSYETMWDTDSELGKMAFGKKAFVFLYTENDINMETAFYAYKHGMTLNSFYFARDINDEVEANIQKYCDELSNGLIRDDTVYIMKSEDYEKCSDYLNSLNAEIKEIDGHAVFVSEEQ